MFSQRKKSEQLSNGNLLESFITIQVQVSIKKLRRKPLLYCSAPHYGNNPARVVFKMPPYEIFSKTQNKTVYVCQKGVIFPKKLLQVSTFISKWFAIMLPFVTSHFVALRRQYKNLREQKCILKRSCFFFLSNHP